MRLLINAFYWQITARCLWVRWRLQSTSLFYHSHGLQAVGGQSKSLHSSSSTTHKRHCRIYMFTLIRLSALHLGNAISGVPHLGKSFKTDARCSGFVLVLPARMIRTQNEDMKRNACARALSGFISRLNTSHM